MLQYPMPPQYFVVLEVVALTQNMLPMTLIWGQVAELGQQASGV